MNTQDLFNIHEATALLGTYYKKLWYHCRVGNIPCTRIGPHQYLDASQIKTAREFLDRKKTGEP